MYYEILKWKEIDIAKIDTNTNPESATTVMQSIIYIRFWFLDPPNWFLLIFNAERSHCISSRLQAIMIAMDEILIGNGKPF